MAVSHRLVRALACAALAWVGVSVADTRIERLVMPGPLAQSHARYENECERCHELFSKSAQTRLCRDCHEDIDADIKARRGMHGRITDIDTTECRACHTDHVGRDADIVQLDEGTFQHTRTDFELSGAHSRLPCEACHAAGKPRRDAPHDCHACHEKQDAHQGKLGERCEKCHDTGTWTAAREKFDHAKTRFPLRDKHADASCASCHPAQRYRDVPRDCHACHTLNDVHAGRYGDKCDKCHRESDWKKLAFDHDRDTKFRLEGRHRDTACDACHTGRLYEDKLAGDCQSCHRKDDQHAGRNGTNCGDCHASADWSKVRFDHDKDTRFGLGGRHAAVDCNACHAAGGAAREAPRNCFGCHRKDDHHHGDFGQKCANCHRVESWQVLNFNHDRDTKYPLLGRHAMTACDGCHTEGSYAKKLGTACADCHGKADPHKEQLGRDCGHCHAPEGWKPARFDHDLTRFPLVGLHATQPCAACHASAAFQDASEACNDCHREDDAHDGRLGPACATCHNPNGWSVWRFDHDQRTDYPLTGRHRGLSCTACHTRPSEGELELPHTCNDCHDADDAHNGAFGRRCDDCHTTEDFKRAEVRR